MSVLDGSESVVPGGVSCRMLVDVFSFFPAEHTPQIYPHIVSAHVVPQGDEMTMGVDNMSVKLLCHADGHACRVLPVRFGMQEKPIIAYPEPVISRIGEFPLPYTLAKEVE